MVDEAPRYAVYFVPAAESGLYRFGSSVLQYDCYTGRPLPPPEECAADAGTWRKATDEPRRYGFHATLKAPFRLAPSSTEAQLVSALRSFAALGRKAAAIEPEIRMLSGFSALVPARESPAVEALAADCTTIFDAFRAPMSPQERARRLASGLNPSQVENLDRWGYPYLFADFRFHMTLTGKIEADRREPMIATLRRAFARMCGANPIAIDRLALVKQDTPDQAFRVLSHAALRTA
jgi:putative phosphonate metabolism protein